MSGLGHIDDVPGIDLSDADADFAAIKPRREREEIDVDITPMIDITFLMLIFFLVSSTPDQSTAVDLPKAGHGEAVSQLQSVVVTVGDIGLGTAPVYLADGKIESARLPDDADLQAEAIEEAVRKGYNDGKTDVVIKADGSVLHREISRVIKAVSLVEGMKIHLAVLETS